MGRARESKSDGQGENVRVMDRAKESELRTACESSSERQIERVRTTERVREGE